MSATPWSVSYTHLDVYKRQGVPQVIMIPDRFLAANVARQTGVEVIVHPGACEVHERFTPGDIRQVRVDHPGVTVLAHPECPPEVVDEADFAGSTAQMVAFVDTLRRSDAGTAPRQVALITECSMSDNVAQAYPDIDFVRPCNPVSYTHLDVYKRQPPRHDTRSRPSVRPRR